MSHIIYLVRHGETTWNRAGRLQGQLDAPLTDVGVTQARAMGQTLAELLADQVYTFHASPLGRTQQTAALIADAIGHDFFDIRMDARLMEITLGDHDGYTGWGDWKRENPEMAAVRDADPWNYQHPNGESSQMLQDRLRPVLAEWGAAGGVHVVVAHGVVNKILRGLYLGLTPDQVFALDRPQDVVHRFLDGVIQEIPAGL